MSEPTRSKSPLDDVRDLILKPVEIDPESGRKVHQALLGMGREGDFGRLGEAAEWLATWQRRFPPRIEKPTLAIFAGSHGLVESGVSLSSNEDTRAHIEALKSGRAPLSAIAAQVGANVRVFELALDKPTPSIAETAAMSERECAATIAFGFEAVEDNPDLLAIAVSGAGVGTVAAAVACALYGGSPEYWVRPSAQTPAGLSKKRVELVSAALKVHRGHLSDPLESLRCLGGREIAACVGAIIAARHQGIPVLLDGFATTIAAGIVHAVSPQAVSHCLASHITQRPAHEAALERIGLKPLVQLEFQTGSGLGSATAVGLLKTACAPFIAKPAEG
ncbi:MAG: nicotinate-nucleotide--dimethylbenzimidazole phosphoribosyltransferase [Hyphomonas sp. 34-62-18]|nr:nicotinate-nucleotide--dimethylbenzimidazole phosphoribosyltransferase [Hyphomonas sp. 34-62-18]OZB15656.1 MAG: nicotinate-nucleotide--dimethylbenzimidazole phosphoribosyltransferase [Hyphomonas sp. 34-62-18]